MESNYQFMGLRFFVSDKVYYSIETKLKCSKNTSRQNVTKSESLMNMNIPLSKCETNKRKKKSAYSYKLSAIMFAY